MSDQFIPHFQPIVDVPSRRISGYEALARRVKDNGQVTSCGPYFADPNVDKEFLLQLDRTVRRKAIESIKLMPDDTFLTLNISPEWISQLKPGDPVPTIEMVKESMVDPKRIIIEITEVEGNLDSILRLVDSYREMGMRIAIDDFGAGYSEMGRLVALEPDLIKIDMRFFKSAVEGGIAHDAVRAVGFMAERIGCDILVEGVENEHEFNFAIDCGAQLIQGFLFFQPKGHFVAPSTPNEQVTQLLAGFVNEKIEAEKDHIKQYQSILQMAYLLRETWRTQKSPDLTKLPRVPEGFVRFYVCQLNGEQISPNYDYYNNEWHADYRYQGMNWSGRPYLYQALALGDMVSRSEITTRPYRDRTTREMFQTLGLKLGKDQILLVDYAI